MWTTGRPSWARATKSGSSFRPRRRPGRWTRDFLLKVDGWAKDRDPNTAFSATVEPLPFHAMSRYPYPAASISPMTPIIAAIARNTTPGPRFGSSAPGRQQLMLPAQRNVCLKTHPDALRPGSSPPGPGTQYLLSRIDLRALAADLVVNPVLHAAVEVQASVRWRMRPQPTRAAAGSLRGPLHGVPFSVKDSIEQAGSRCTAGTFGRRDAPPSTADATLVERLRNAAPSPSRDESAGPSVRL